MRSLWAVVGLISCLAVSWAWIAPAEAVWQYVLVDPSGQETTYYRPPIDLTYPLPGVPTPMLDVAKDQRNQGTPLTPDEERARLETPHLMIYDTQTLGERATPAMLSAESVVVGSRSTQKQAAASSSTRENQSRGTGSSKGAGDSGGRSYSTGGGSSKGWDHSSSPPPSTPATSRSSVGVQPTDFDIADSGPSVGAESAGFDVARHCEEVSQATKGDYEIQICIEHEQAAKKKVAGMQVEARLLSHCKDVATFAGGSYLIMERCLRDELDATGQLGR